MKEEKTIRNLRLLLDVPEDDVIFGFNEYASVLASAIVGTEPHFTIGIFGQWGTGKTTLLRKIEWLLKASSPNVITVFFDVWRYQREEHMLLPMLDKISDGLKQNQSNMGTLYEIFKRLTTTMAVGLKVKSPYLEFDPKNAKDEWQSMGIKKSDYYNWLSELQAAL